MSEFESNNIVSRSVADYLESFSGESPEPARRMEREARRRDFPIVGPQVGRFLDLLAGAIEPSTIVELGSGFGYSAYWFGRSLKMADIHLTDYDSDNLEKARSYLSECEGSNNYHFHEGDALKLLESIGTTIDLLFVDIDKEAYPKALDRAEDRLDAGSWLIADNVLWRGRVASPEESDEATEAIRRFNDQLSGSAWTSSLLPLRDGLAIARRE